MIDGGWRWIFAALFVTIVTISSVYRVRARRQETIPRSAEGWAMATLRTVTGLLLLLAVVLAFVAPSALAWSRLGLDAAARWLGAALAAAAVAFTTWALDALGPNVSETVLTKRSHRLVTGGPYRWIRHPLYTGSVVFFAGLGLLADSGPLLAVALLAGLFMRLAIVPREETELVARFGKRYRELQDRTGALLPRLRRRRSGRG